MHRIVLAALVLLGMLWHAAQAPPAQAQDAYPNRPIRLVVPYPAGGTADAMARALGQELMVAWGQPVVVENRPGASTIIGAEFVARSAPDGYTLLFTTDSTLTINPMLHKQLSYQPQKDFAPITVIGYQDLVLVVHPSVSARTLEEFVALAKAKPGTLNYGSFGNGSQPHLAMEMFSQLAGISLMHVPSKGIAQVLTDLLSDTVQTAFVCVSAAGLIRDGKVRGLAMGGDQRSPLFGDVPTFAEKGYPQMYARAWWGIVAPAGTPGDIIEKLNIGLNRVIRDPQFQEKRMLPQGLDPAGTSPAEFAELIRDDAKRWANVLELAGIRPECRIPCARPVRRRPNMPEGVTDEAVARFYRARSGDLHHGTLRRDAACRARRRRDQGRASGGRRPVSVVCRRPVEPAFPSPQPAQAQRRPGLYDAGRTQAAAFAHRACRRACHQCASRRGAAARHRRRHPAPSQSEARILLHYRFRRRRPVREPPCL